MLDLILMLVCPGDIRSSAVPISPDRVISAEHAVARDGCGTEPIWWDREYDLYIGAHRNDEFYSVSCEGIIDGQTYTLIGYERRMQGKALPLFRSVQTETGIHDNMRAIEGGATVGMSGGAVLNRSGALVGVISATNGEVTYVRDFSTTSLCSGSGN